MERRDGPGQNPSEFDLDAIRTLVHAVREAMLNLAFPETAQSTVNASILAMERTLAGQNLDIAEIRANLRTIRYHLMESSTSPVAAFLADSTARVLGDDIGRLFL